jgi:hypothetical protein
MTPIKYNERFGEILVGTYALNNVMERYYSVIDYSIIKIYEKEGETIYESDYPDVIHETLLAFRLKKYYLPRVSEEDSGQDESKIDKLYDILLNSYNSNNSKRLSFKVLSYGTYIFDCDNKLLFKFGSWDTFLERILKHFKFKKKKHKRKEESFAVLSTNNSQTYNLGGTSDYYTTTSKWTTSGS